MRYQVIVTLCVRYAKLSYCRSQGESASRSLVPSNSWSRPRIYLDKYCIFLLTSVVLISDRPRRTPPSRHVTKIPSPQLLYFPHSQNCDARNSFRIRSYAKCCVSLTLSSLFPLFAQRKFYKSFAIKRFCTLSENSRVYPDSSHSGTPCCPCSPYPRYFPTSLPPCFHPAKLKAHHRAGANHV